MSQKEYYQVQASGWGRLMGEVDFGSAAVSTAGTGNSGGEQYLAKFLSPMSAIAKTIKTEAEKKYEVGLNVTSDSETGFFTATVSFLNEAGVPVGFPATVGIKLSTLQPGQSSPVSLVTGPAPKGAAQVQLALCTVGTSPGKYVGVGSVTFNEVQ